MLRADRRSRPAATWRAAVGDPLLGPVRGALIGGAAGFVDVAVRSRTPPNTLLGPALAVAVVVLLTAGRPLEGLSRTADAIAGMGVIAVAVDLVVQVAALDALHGWHRGTISLVIAVTVARLAVGWLVVPPTALRRVGMVAMTILVYVGAAAIGYVDETEGEDGLVRAVWSVTVALAVAAVVHRLLSRRMGDEAAVSGVVIEVTTVTTLIAMAVLVV